MSLGPKSNFIPVVYAGTRKKKYNKKTQRRKNGHKKKIHARRTST
jgi:hypothetical protein